MRSWAVRLVVILSVILLVYQYVNNYPGERQVILEGTVISLPTKGYQNFQYVTLNVGGKEVEYRFRGDRVTSIQEVRTDGSRISKDYTYTPDEWIRTTVAWGKDGAKLLSEDRGPLPNKDLLNR